MGRAPSHKKVRYKAKKPDVIIKCSKQFPDCPDVPNEKDCRLCPLYKNKQ
tara:strand:+ start:2090 stop:2239 length:150 start_codon:yes stop_codon:yes gene_type:complete